MSASLRGAINAKCRECIYDPVGGTGTWREQVTACTATACPLYPVRPRAKVRGSAKLAVFRGALAAQQDGGIPEPPRSAA